MTNYTKMIGRITEKIDVRTGKFLNFLKTGLGDSLGRTTVGIFRKSAIGAIGGRMSGKYCE